MDKNVQNLYLDDANNLLGEKIAKTLLVIHGDECTWNKVKSIVSLWNSVEGLSSEN